MNHSSSFSLKALALLQAYWLPQTLTCPVTASLTRFAMICSAEAVAVIDSFSLARMVVTLFMSHRIPPSRLAAALRRSGKGNKTRASEYTDSPVSHTMPTSDSCVEQALWHTAWFNGGCTHSRNRGQDQERNFIRDVHCSPMELQQRTGRYRWHVLS